jgi:HAD superfamily hydrolase (TIGR01509 family)
MKLPFAPAAVIFDMDGLLFDTEALYQRATVAAGTAMGVDLSPVLDLMVGLPWPQVRLLLLDRYGEAFPVDGFLKEVVERFEVMAKTDLTVKPGVFELLEVLDVLGLPRAIATASAHRTVDRHLAAHGLAGRFHEIVAHGDYVNSKPAPDPFLKASERLGVEPRLCLALEDSLNGVKSAAAAGMMTVMVPDLLEPTEETRQLGVLVVRSLFEVTGLVAG